MIVFLFTYKLFALNAKNIFPMILITLNLLMSLLCVDVGLNLVNAQKLKKCVYEFHLNFFKVCAFIILFLISYSFNQHMTTLFILYIVFCLVRLMLQISFVLYLPVTFFSFPYFQLLFIYIFCVFLTNYILLILLLLSI